VAQEGEYVLIHDPHHLTRFKVFEAGPAEVVVRLAFVVASLREDASLHRGAEIFRLAFSNSMKIVKPVDEHQEGELFDD
jgi:hypothetical protein